MIRISLCLAAVLTAAPSRAAVLAGIDVLEESGFAALRGKRVGLITNHTGRNKSGRSTIEVIARAPTVRLVALFTPEHGLAGTIEGRVSSGTYTLENGSAIPVFDSLYSPSLISPDGVRTAAPDLASRLKLDAIVFDIQDIGARFYTYAASMGVAMGAAAKSGVAFYVLDRPNPINGTVVEGPILAPEIRHITAYFPIPVRHGLTIGEIARLHNLAAEIKTRLTVVPLKGWSRELWYDETDLPWTKPSPNMPDVDAAALYPGVGCFEATNMAVGRGTPIPFRWIGAPWLNSRKIVKRLEKARLPGVSFSRETFTPTKSVFEGKKCDGIRITITDRDALRPLDVFAHMFCAVRDVHPKDFEVKWAGMRRMIGTDRFQEAAGSKDCPERLIELFHEGPREFENVRRSVLLY